MTPKRWLALLLVLALALGACSGPDLQASVEPPVLLLTLKGPLTPAMHLYLERGLRTAERLGAQAVILQLDTPGGSIDTMQALIQTIRNSPTPVVVYVAPRGAMAASAGTLLTLAAHYAAMAPETTIGAASPVGGQGEDLGETLEAKTKQVLAATARSLAERRGPEAVRLAEATIMEARAVHAQEALSTGLVDALTPSLEDLLRQLDGVALTTAAGTVTLHTAQAPVQTLAPTFLESLLHTLTNPNLVFILLTIGVQALLIELSNPGSWFPGFVGVVALALAAYGLGVLNVNWFGLVLLALAFVLFVLDVKATAHGALTVAGVVSFILGALILFNSPLIPGSRPTPGLPTLSWPLVVGTGVGVGLLTALAVGLGLRAQQRPVRTGEAQTVGLVGQRGFARTPLRPGQRGSVQIAGELWTAELAPGAPPVDRDAPVEVVAVNKLRLVVRPLTQATPAEVDHSPSTDGDQRRKSR